MGWGGGAVVGSLRSSRASAVRACADRAGKAGAGLRGGFDAAPGPAGQVPCGAHTPGRLRCRRPAAFAAEPQGFSLGPPCGRTSPDVLRSSAPHRRRHAGPPRPCQPPPWTSIPEQPRCLRQGCGHSRLTASAAPSTAAARGKSGAAGDGPARSLEVLARRRQDGGIAAASRCEERRGPGPQGRALQRRASGCARSLARANL